VNVTVLIAEDDQVIREGIATALRRDHFEVRAVANGNEAVRALLDEPADVVVADLKMPGLNGLELLDRIHVTQPDTIFIIATAFGAIGSAVDAMKKGAYDYLTKPIQLDRLSLLIRKALQARDLRRENEALRRQLGERLSFQNIIGQSPGMLAVLSAVEQVAATDATVLIRGESGTGKELIAQAHHYAGKRATGPFVSVNCAGFAETLLEDELFGHERGAFTGADRRRAGRFESANGGTLFLDEIGDLSPTTQAKLLRVLEDRSFQRLGGSETLRVNVRLVAATNRDLEEMVTQGAFRVDLYYRIKVVSLRIPALRERADDIPLLVNYFLVRFSDQHGKAIKGVDSSAMRILTAYPWPGNVRELRNCMEEMVVLAKHDVLTEVDLPTALAGFDMSRHTYTVQAGIPLREVERRAILQTLHLVSGNKRKAAELLSIGPATLYRKMGEYGLTG
jgi:two-component system, NtrC family, response regulator AtoC